MIWKHRHVVVDNLTPPPKRKHDKMGSGALPLSTSDYLPTPLWLNSWTNTSCSQSDIPFDCNCIYWLVSKDHYNGLFFSTAPTWIGLVAIIIPKIHGWHFFPPKKKLICLSINLYIIHHLFWTTKTPKPGLSWAISNTKYGTKRSSKVRM